MDRIALFVVLVLGSVLLLSTPAQAADCAKEYRQKRYRQAGGCFLRAARKVGPTSRLKSAARLKKGSLLRSAAISLMKAATALASKRPRDAAYLRERANYALRSYYRDKLCASPSRCKAARRQSQKLYGLIGYARLTLHFPQTPVAVMVKGFRYRTTKIIKRSPWRLRLRPGNYDISLIGLGQQKKIASVKLARSTKKTWRYKPKTAARTPVVARRVTPPVRRVVPRRPPPRRLVIVHVPARRVAPPKRPTPRRVVTKAPVRRVIASKRPIPPPVPTTGVPTAAVVAYVVGGVFLLTGGISGIVALVKYDEGVNRYNDPASSYQSATDAVSVNFVTTLISVIALPTGLAIMGVGGILHAVLQKKPQATPGNATITSKHTKMPARASKPTQATLLLKGRF